MTVWPGTLPQNQFIGLTEVDVDAVLRTQMDSGPPSRRNRFAASMRFVRTPIILTGSQKQTFDTFFRTTLKNGSLAFDWEDPTTDATVSFAFRGPPQWGLVTGGDVNSRKWSAILNLEIQP